MDLNLVVLCGRLATDPELRVFESGTRLIRLSGDGAERRAASTGRRRPGHDVGPAGGPRSRSCRRTGAGSGCAARCNADSGRHPMGGSPASRWWPSRCTSRTSTTWSRSRSDSVSAGFRGSLRGTVATPSDRSLEVSHALVLERRRRPFPARRGRSTPPGRSTGRLRSPSGAETDLETAASAMQDDNEIPLAA